MLRFSKNILLGLVICVLACGSAIAQDASKIGVVDSVKVLSEAPRLKQYDEDLNKFVADLSQKLDVRSQNLMLNEAEVTELIGLKAKANLTDQEKTRAAELGQAEKDRGTELTTLQNTAEPNDAQKARLKELQDIQQKSQDTGRALYKDYQAQIQAKQVEINTLAEKDLMEAVKNIATAQGLSLVVLKNSVLFGGTDITEAVIAALDRKAEQK